MTLKKDNRDSCFGMQVVVIRKFLLDMKGARKTGFCVMFRFILQSLQVPYPVRCSHIALFAFVSLSDVGFVDFHCSTFQRKLSSKCSLFPLFLSFFLFFYLSVPAQPAKVKYSWKKGHEREISTLYLDELKKRGFVEFPSLLI